MSDVNKVTIVGTIGADPRRNETKTGKRVVNLRVGTKHANGSKESTSWHTIVLWEELADAAAEWRKGDRVAIEGRIQRRSWDKDGVTVWETDIVAQKAERTESAQLTRGDTDPLPF